MTMSFLIAFLSAFVSFLLVFGTLRAVKSR